MKYKALICFLLMFSLLLGVPAFAESDLPDTESTGEAVAEIPSNELVETEQIGTMDTITGEEMITIEPIDGGNNGEISLMGTFTNPKEAFLKVSTNCYAAPSPNNGYLLQTLPANTKVWVVERKYSSDNNRYYYYAGYNYNGASHRGYFCEDNVYLTSSTRLLPANVDSERDFAGYKVHTSKEGTVYDGPADTYSTMGTVGVESIKLIRTDGDYNFIEYTVTGTNKVKRGYLHYSYITDVWSSLTAQAASKLNGKTFYLKNTATGKYMQAATAEVIQDNRMVQNTFTGETHQIFKFVYYGSGTQKYFRIIPANCYSDTAPFWLTTQSIASHPHPDRKAMIYPDRPNKAYQRYWVVKREGTTDCYKIVPVSSYGTMTLTNRPSGSTYNVNQYYTNTETDDIAADIWQFVDTTQIFDETEITRYEQDKSNWCWVASAKMAASTETPFYGSISQSSVVQLIKNSTNNVTGSLSETAKASNYYVSQNLNSGNFVEKIGYYYSEPIIRRFIIDGHAINVSMQPSSGSGHAIVLMGFEWVDLEGSDSEYAPGYYLYYCLDPGENKDDMLSVEHQELTEYSRIFTDYYATWKHSVVYSTAYINQTIAFDEGDA